MRRCPASHNSSSNSRLHCNVECQCLCCLCGSPLPCQEENSTCVEKHRTMSLRHRHTQMNRLKATLARSCCVQCPRAALCWMWNQSRWDRRPWSGTTVQAFLVTICTFLCRYTTYRPGHSTIFLRIPQLVCPEGSPSGRIRGQNRVDSGSNPVLSRPNRTSQTEEIQT